MHPKPAQLRVALALITDSSCTHCRLWEMPVPACSCTKRHVWDPPSWFFCGCQLWNVCHSLGCEGSAPSAMTLLFCSGRSCRNGFLLRGPFSRQSWTYLVFFNCFLISLEKGLIRIQWYVCCLFVFCWFGGNSCYCQTWASEWHSWFGTRWSAGPIPNQTILWFFLHFFLSPVVIYIRNEWFKLFWGIWAFP